MSKTFMSIILMFISALIGFFLGAMVNDPIGGSILFAMITGIACIVYAIDKKR